MSLDQWDAEIAPKLQEIELSAGWIAFYARKAEQAVKELAHKAPFDTNAVDAMVKARDTLVEASITLTEARKSYEKKERVA